MEPDVTQCFLGCEPLLRILRNHLQKQIFPLIRYMSEHHINIVIVTKCILGHDLLGIGTVEQVPASQ